MEECPLMIRQGWTYAAQQLEQYGAKIRIVSHTELSPELVQHALAAYYILVTAEASSNLARYDGFRYGAVPSRTRMDGHGDSSGKDTTTTTTTTSSGEDDEDQKAAIWAAVQDWEKDTAAAAEHRKGDVAIVHSSSSSFTLLEHQFSKVRSWGFGEEVIRRILCGTAVLSSDQFHSYYESAAKLRALLTQQLTSCLGVNRNDQDNQPCDVLLVPTSLSFPPPKLQRLQSRDYPNKEDNGNTNNSNSRIMSPVEAYANDVMTVPASLAGLPAVSVPIPLDRIRSKGHPTDPTAPHTTTTTTTSTTATINKIFHPAMQFIGSRRNEALLLEVASVLEHDNQNNNN